MTRPRLIILRPKHPERVCWGCDRYCSADDMACGKERSPHPIEGFGEQWNEDTTHDSRTMGSKAAESVG